MIHARTILAAALGCAFICSGAIAGPVTISEGWFRSLPAGRPAGGYFKLHNGGDQSITLKSASSPGCGTVLVHQSMHTSGMQHMMPAGDLDVAPGDTLVFAPGGYHLMCMEPTAQMKQGATVPVTLNFAGGASVTADFAVRNASGN